MAPTLSCSVGAFVTIQFSLHLLLHLYILLKWVRSVVDHMQGLMEIRRCLILELRHCVLNRRGRVITGLTVRMLHLYLTLLWTYWTLVKWMMPFLGSYAGINSSAMHTWFQHFHLFSCSDYYMPTYPWQSCPWPQPSLSHRNKSCENFEKIVNNLWIPKGLISFPYDSTKLMPNYLQMLMTDSQISLFCREFFSFDKKNIKLPAKCSKFWPFSQIIM